MKSGGGRGMEIFSGNEQKLIRTQPREKGKPMQLFHVENNHTPGWIEKNTRNYPEKLQQHKVNFMNECRARNKVHQLAGNGTEMGTQ